MRVLPFALFACILFATLGVAPESNTEITAPTTAREVLTRMTERNPTLHSYVARVHVNVHMQSFPFLAPQLDGTSYFKRPDLYLVVFDRMPSYAKGFGRLFNEIGNPQAWEKDQNISLDGTTLLNDRPTFVLRLTKKIHSDILDHTLAYVDAASYALMQMEWYYTSGGKITMTQQYRQEGTYYVIGQQHATIHIPHVRAIADATYATYQTNVPVQTP